MDRLKKLYPDMEQRLVCMPMLPEELRDNPVAKKLVHRESSVLETLGLKGLLFQRGDVGSYFYFPVSRSWLNVAVEIREEGGDIMLSPELDVKRLIKSDWEKTGMKQSFTRTTSIRYICLFTLDSYSSVSRIESFDLILQCKANQANDELEFHEHWLTLDCHHRIALGHAKFEEFLRNSFVVLNCYRSCHSEFLNLFLQESNKNCGRIELQIQGNFVDNETLLSRFDSNFPHISTSLKFLSVDNHDNSYSAMRRLCRQTWSRGVVVVDWPLIFRERVNFTVPQANDTCMLYDGLGKCISILVAGSSAISDATSFYEEIERCSTLIVAFWLFLLIDPFLKNLTSGVWSEIAQSINFVVVFQNEAKLAFSDLKKQEKLQLTKKSHAPELSKLAEKYQLLKSGDLENMKEISPSIWSQVKIVFQSKKGKFVFFKPGNNFKLHECSTENVFERNGNLSQKEELAISKVAAAIVLGSNDKIQNIRRALGLNNLNRFKQIEKEEHDDIFGDSSCSESSEDETALTKTRTMMSKTLRKRTVQTVVQTNQASVDLKLQVPDSATFPVRNPCSKKQPTFPLEARENSGSYGASQNRGDISESDSENFELSYYLLEKSMFRKWQIQYSNGTQKEQMQFLLSIKNYYENEASPNPTIKEEILALSRAVTFQSFSNMPTDQFHDFLFQIISLGEGSQLIEWLLELDIVGLSKSPELRPKLSHLLLKACRKNMLKTVEVVILILEKFETLQSELEAIEETGNTIFTLLCQNADVDLEILKAILQYRFPVGLVLHQFEGKNALEWAEFHGKPEMKTLLMSNETFRTAFELSSDDRQNLGRKIDASKSLTNIVNKLEEMRSNMNEIAQTYSEKSIHNFDSLQKLLQTTHDLALQINSAQKPEKLDFYSMEKVCESLTNCANFLRSMIGFVSFKMKNLSHGEEKANNWTELEGNYFTSLQTNVTENLGAIERIIHRETPEPKCSLPNIYSSQI